MTDSSSHQPDEIKNLNQLAIMLGSLGGQLTVLQNQIEQGNNHTSQRIDDLRGAIDRQSKSLNRRIDDHRKSVDERFTNVEDNVKSVRNKSLAGSGVVTLVLNGFFKLLEKSL